MARHYKDMGIDQSQVRVGEGSVGVGEGSVGVGVGGYGSIKRGRRG